MRSNYGNSGGNSRAIHGNSDPKTAIQSPGEGSKCEERGNSRPGKVAFIKLEKEGSHMEGVRETAAASRLLPGRDLRFSPTRSQAFPTGTLEGRCSPLSAGGHFRIWT